MHCVYVRAHVSACLHAWSAVMCPVLWCKAMPVLMVTLFPMMYFLCLQDLAPWYCSPIVVASFNYGDLIGRALPNFKWFTKLKTRALGATAATPPESALGSCKEYVTQ